MSYNMTPENEFYKKILTGVIISVAVFLIVWGLLVVNAQKREVPKHHSSVSDINWGNAKEDFLRKPAVADLAREEFPSYSYCEKCRLPWLLCGGGHSVWTEKNVTGVFAMCEYCWSRSTLPEIKFHFESAHIRYGMKRHLSLKHLFKCVEEDFFKNHPSQKDTLLDRNDSGVWHFPVQLEPNRVDTLRIITDSVLYYSIPN